MWFERDLITEKTKYTRELLVIKWSIFVDPRSSNWDNWQASINHKWNWPYQEGTLPEKWKPFFSNVKIDANGNMIASRDIGKDEELFVEYNTPFPQNEKPIWDFTKVKKNLMINVFLLKGTDIFWGDFLEARRSFRELSELFNRSDVKGIDIKKRL